MAPCPPRPTGDAAWTADVGDASPLFEAVDGRRVSRRGRLLDSEDSEMED